MKTEIFKPRPAIHLSHSDFSLKFSEIQMTWLQIQIFFALKLVEIAI